jgi:hypothetical protein
MFELLSILVAVERALSRVWALIRRHVTLIIIVKRR